MAKKKPYWILLVEDEPEIRFLVREKILKLLPDFNICFAEAKDGLEASEYIKEQMFDCIITDLQMPRRTGAEFIDIVQKNPLNSHVPIIILTGFADNEWIERFPDTIMFQKPFDTQQFIQTVRSTFLSA